MADIFPSLALSTLPELGTKPSIEGGLRSWILTGSYLPNAFTPPVLTLDVSFSERLVHHLAFDFERFSLASRESLAVSCAELESHNVAGWPLLKLYYSAFFAAHAIMRSQGWGVTSLELAQTSYLNEIVQIVIPGAPMIKNGMYLFRAIRSKGDTYSVTLEPSAQTDGVHESFWKLFCKFLTDTSTAAARQNAANSNLFIAGVSEICANIQFSNNNAGIWLSTIRNHINYQQRYETWFPSAKKDGALAAVRNVRVLESNKLQMNFHKSKNTLLAFSSVCRYLACLNIEISDHVAARTKRGSNFGQKWRRICEQLPTK